MMIEVQNFIGGVFRPAQKGRTLDNYEPATGQVYGTLPDSDHHDVDAAVQAAKHAFQDWSRQPVRRRAELLNRIADLIDLNAVELSQAESQDQGKPVWLASSVDIPRAAANFRFFAGAIQHQSEQATQMDRDALNIIVRKPVGVAGLIAPWNLPLYLLTWKIAPALAAGNTAVCKPSELTPRTAYLLAKIFEQAELPAGVCNLVFGSGIGAGAPLVSHQDVALISFTGGTKTAESIISGSASGFKKLSLELGGKNPCLIFNDADLDTCVATTLRSSFLNQGEICLCNSRILVQEQIYDAFLKEFVRQVRDLRVGDPRDDQSFMGALISQSHQEKVLRFVNDAKRDGAEIHSGETSLQLPIRCKNGFFVAPTIISGLSANHAINQEEIFGPVVSISSFRDEAEAVALANGVRYGLAATVWTSDLARAHRLSYDLDVGQLWVNTWMKRDLRVPFGGMKASGLGREGGTYSLDFFSETTTACFQIASAKHTQTDSSIQGVSHEKR